MQTTLFRRLAPSLAARFQRNENLLTSFSSLSSSSSSSVLHHVTSSSSSSADVEPVHITENCVRRIKELDSNEPSTAGKMLRLSVETGGCSGFQYAFNLDDRVNSDDRVFEKEGAPPPILNPPQPPPQPNPSFFSPTLSPTQHYTHFLHFLNAHLTPPLTPQTLTHFLKSKLHHHPSFTHYDFHLFNWASTLDTFSHNHTSYEWMTQTLALSHRFSLLRILLSFISSNPCTCSHAIFSCPKTESIFRFAIHAYCKASKFDDALFAYNCMRRLIDGKPSVSVCNILIHGFVKSGRFDRAFEFYNEMVKDRVKPDVFTFNILISGYCRNFKFGSALEMFDEMRKTGCHPNVVTFNTLIKGLFRERRVDEGIGMVYEMIELGCQLSNVTCEILVDGLCKEGQVLKACELLMELSKRGVLPKGYDYFVLVEVLCGNGDAFKALEVIYELWSKGCVPSLISCIVMIDGLRGLGKIEEAMRLVEKMLKEEGMVLDVVTFIAVLQDLCDAGRTEEANRLRLLALSKGLEPNGMTYRILVTGYRGEGNRSDGELVVNEMLDRGFIPDLASYNKLMDGLSNSQRRGIIK